MKAVLISSGTHHREDLTIVEIRPGVSDDSPMMGMGINLILCPKTLWEDFRKDNLYMALYPCLYPPFNPDKPLAQYGRILLTEEPIWEIQS